MRILYDGSIYGIQAAGGINRYFANLISRLPKDYVPTLATSVLRDINFPSHPNLHTLYHKRFSFRPGRVAYWVEGYFFKLAYHFQNFDIIHPTYYSLLTQQDTSHCRFPTVLTVYDMIHEIFYPDDPTVEMKRRSIQSAQAIICISESTKRDLLERFDIPEEKVTITYLASEVNISLSYGSELVPEHPYYLYVGSRASYKNFDGLIAAFAKVASINFEAKLCVVGSAFNEAESKLIAEMGLSDRIEYYGHVNNNHLAKLYRCSIAFIYPSLYEGFGIPPLEAMSSGTVAIVANSSSLPEVVGDAGLLFDPKSTLDLADLMLLLLDQPIKRNALIEKGFERAKIFSWDKTFAQTLDVYRSLTL
jgi:glycosyltransferase involved in cell wall biosynthesis